MGNESIEEGIVCGGVEGFGLCVFERSLKCLIFELKESECGYVNELLVENFFDGIYII